MQFPETDGARQLVPANPMLGYLVHRRYAASSKVYLGVDGLLTPNLWRPSSSHSQKRALVKVGSDRLFLLLRRSSIWACWAPQGNTDRMRHPRCGLREPALTALLAAALSGLAAAAGTLAHPPTPTQGPAPSLNPAVTHYDFNVALTQLAPDCFRERPAAEPSLIIMHARSETNLL